VVGPAFAEGSEATAGRREHRQLVGRIFGKDGHWGSHESQPSHPQGATRVRLPRLSIEPEGGAFDHVCHVGPGVPPAYVTLGLPGDERQGAQLEGPLDGQLPIVDGGAERGGAPEGPGRSQRQHRLRQITRRTGRGLERRIQLPQGSQFVRRTQQGQAVGDGFAKAISREQRGRIGPFEQQSPTFGGDGGDGPMLVKRGSGQVGQGPRGEVSICYRDEDVHPASMKGELERGPAGSTAPTRL
jgi:hypothetical protein